MGVITDLLANAKTIKTTTGGQPVGASKLLYHKLNDLKNVQGDFDYPSGTTNTNEVQKVALHVAADGGTYKLNFNLYGGTTFATANVAWNATNSVISGAINTAATSASVAGWTNGDVVVAGGPLNTTNATFTYSGTSVSKRNQGQMTIDGANLTNGNNAGTAGAATTTTQGAGDRSAWASMVVLGLTNSTPPAQGVAVSSFTASAERGTFPHQLDNDCVKDLIREVAIENYNEATSEATMLAAFGF